MRTAHSRWIEYGDDTRDGADWMKAHALVGAETMVVMGVEFTGSRGKGTHDSHFILPLVRAALETFPLVYVLGDKAYLAEAVLGELWKPGIKAVIPVKKSWDHLTKSLYYEACEHLAQWCDQRQAEFHELHRLRVKVEVLSDRSVPLRGRQCALPATTTASYRRRARRTSPRTRLCRNKWRRVLGPRCGQ